METEPGTPGYDAPAEGEDLESVVRDFLQWADETFPDATPETCIAHLRSGDYVLDVEEAVRRLVAREFPEMEPAMGPED